ncbi:MAG: YceD family protein [Aliihoeflea sp.]
MIADEDGKSPLSFLVNVARLPARGMPVRIVADETQRTALAQAHELLSLERLEAELVVSAWKSRGVRVAGTLKADFAQECVVTLEPIANRMKEPVSAVFAPEGSRLLNPDLAEVGEILLDAEGPDSPEPFRGNEIDVGQLVEEFFALGIDPYPRKTGAELQTPVLDVEEPRGPLHDKLAALKKKG